MTGDRAAPPPLAIDDHPLLDAAAFVTTFPGSLGECPSSPSLVEALKLDPDDPTAPGDDVRGAVRDLLRHGGYKPTGRGKPASEYLLRAAAGDGIRPINLAVDACNAVSLHTGLPISVIDLDRARPPFTVAIAPAGSAYAFNPSGQVIKLDGLLCLNDAEGPTANAVKDAQRTKTDEATRRTLSVVWGTRALPGLCTRALDGYLGWLRAAGADVRVWIRPTS